MRTRGNLVGCDITGVPRRCQRVYYGRQCQRRHLGNTRGVGRSWIRCAVFLANRIRLLRGRGLHALAILRHDRRNDLYLRQRADVRRHRHLLKKQAGDQHQSRNESVAGMPGHAVDHNPIEESSYWGNCMLGSNAMPRKSLVVVQTWALKIDDVYIAVSAASAGRNVDAGSFNAFVHSKCMPPGRFGGV